LKGNSLVVQIGFQALTGDFLVVQVGFQALKGYSLLEQAGFLSAQSRLLLAEGGFQSLAVLLTNLFQVSVALFLVLVEVAEHFGEVANGLNSRNVVLSLALGNDPGQEEECAGYLPAQPAREAAEAFQFRNRLAHVGMPFGAVQVSLNQLPDKRIFRTRIKRQRLSDASLTPRNLLTDMGHQVGDFDLGVNDLHHGMASFAFMAAFLSPEDSPGRQGKSFEFQAFGQSKRHWKCN
jgi:hypothetical protein